MNTKFSLKLVALFLLLLVANIQNIVSQSTDYLGQTLPGDIPIIFAPGIVSVNGRYEYGLSISPDGNEIYYTADSPGDGLTIVKRVDGKWTEPKIANLRGNHSWEYEAFFTTDGQKLYFTSDENKISHLYYVNKTSNGWSLPELLNSPVNKTPVFWATFSKNSTMYFTNINEFKIYRSKLVDSSYKEVEKVGLPFGIHPFISPDEDYLLFNNNGDIYIVFAKSDGNWTTPIKFGKQINSSYTETCPSLSPDGKYLFFSRYNEPGEKCNIYWARVDNLIDSLKNATFTSSGVEKAEKKMTVFPNPTKGVFRINFGDIPGKPLEINIYTNEGKKIINMTIHNKSDALIDLSHYPKGIYLLKIMTDGRIFDKKICLE